MPVVTPISPHLKSGATWSPKILSTPFTSPSAIIACAPAPISSPGWKISFTVPANFSLLLASIIAAPSKDAL